MIPQDPLYHQFADQRQWLGVPNAADVLSSAAFLVIGGLGLLLLAARRHPPLPPVAKAGAWCTALGLAGTGLGSAWYHLAPTNESLFWDRLPMTLVFAGVLGTAIAQRVGGQAGRWTLALLVPLGMASVVYWKFTGDLSLYAALQAGGFLALLALAVGTRGVADPFPWAWVIAWYALAKLAELADRQIWDLTGGMISGHTLKHLLAAAAAGAALWPLLKRR